MSADYGRIHRLLKILTTIQGSNGWTAKRLARECGVTERTIYRDMEMLEGAGIPYFYDETTNGYSVRRDFFMPPVQLTLDETLALAALAEHVGGGEQVPFLKPAGRAIAKVRGSLPQSIRDGLAGVEEHLSIKLAATHPPEAAADVYDIVQQALRQKLSLQCTYESAGKTPRKSKSSDLFMLDPYALLFNQRAWYVLGHHSLHGEVRCLKLNRFTQCKLTKLSYTIPKKFSVDKHLGHAWRMIRGKKRHEVEVWFDREFAETVSDTHWHATQDVELHEDESVTIRFKVDGLDEIVWWVLGMGPHCVVKKPKELADLTRKLASEVVKRYAP